MKDAIVAYSKRVKELSEHTKGNEQATKSSLIGPLLTLLGYDLTDPRECIPEFRADFGKDRSVKPVDWAFLDNGRPLFFVEAKDSGKKLGGYDEQLADYFAKAPEAKLGILTNGIQWRFYTDIVNANVMDKEPFVKWDVIADETPPFDFLTLLQKSEFKNELIRTFAERKHSQNLLVQELNRLLEPSAEFTKLAIANIETRNLTTGVVDSWKPIVANAIDAWSKQRALAYVLSSPPQWEQPSAPGRQGPKVETTAEEMQGFEIVQRILGSDRPVEFEDTTAYFKIHLPNQKFWGVCRLYLGRKKPSVMVPLPIDKVQELGLPFACVAVDPRWTNVFVSSVADLDPLAPILLAAWDHQFARRGKGATEEEPDPQ